MIVMIMLLAFALFAGLAVELYKKWIRRGNTADWENRLAAFVLSAILGAIAFLAISPEAVPEGLAYTPWLIAVFTVAIYLLQLPACMEIWKPLVRKWLERKTNG